MKKYMLVLIVMVVLFTLNSCNDYGNKAEIENKKNQTKISDTGRGEAGNGEEEPPMETGA